MGLLYNFTIPLIIGILFLGFSPTFLDFEPQAYKITAFDRLTGPLKENNRLDTGERLFEGEINQPESLAVYDGIIYTGTSDGCITKITGDNMTCFLRLKQCETTTQCSRPLGMRFDRSGTLYVIDGRLGLFSVNITTGSVTQLLETGEWIGGKPLTFPDDLSVSSDGIIYFSDASVKWNLDKVVLSILEHEDSGRVIKFDSRTKESSVLVDGIRFPNGIQLTKSEDSLLIAELSTHKILRHYLKGERKGQTEVFVTLPGKPDNIRSSKNGYWIALVSYHNPAKAGLMDNLSQYPFLRKIVVRTQDSFASLLLFINNYWKSNHLENFAHELQTFFNWLILPDMYGMAVEVDENGKFIQSVQSPSGRSTLLSEILEHDGYLYGGSFFNTYIIKMKNVAD